MAAYYNYTVPVPAVKNITQKRIGNIVYVYYTYKRVKTRTGNLAPVSSTIGKLEPGSEPPMMYPNLNYYTYFAEATPSAAPGIKHDPNIVVGPYMAFQKIVSDYHLDLALKQVFRDSTTIELILDAAAYEVVNETTEMKFFPEYSAGHMSFTSGMKIFNDSTVAKLVRTVDDGIKNNFLLAWAKNLEKSRNAVIFTGATSMVSNRLERPTNYAIAYDEELGLPVYYEANYGNLPVLSEVMEEVYERGYGKILNVQDGSNLPKRNVLKQLNSTANPAVILKGIRKTTSDYKLQVLGQFEGKEQYRIPGTDLYACSQSVRFYPNDEDTFYFHVFYDECAASRQRKIINQTVDRYLNELNQLIGTARAEEVNTKYIKYFDLQYSGQSDGTAILSGVERNIPAIQKALDDAGYFTIVTADISSAEEAYKRVCIRDMEDELLVWSKPFLGAVQEQSHTEKNVSSIRGRFFVGFIASILRSAIYHELTKRNQDKNSRLYGCTVFDVVKELESVTASLSPDATYRLQSGESPMVLEILEMLSLTPDAIRSTIAKLNYELGLAAETVSSAHAAATATKASLYSKVDRLCGALDILSESYESLIKEASDENKDISEIRKRVGKHIHPDWVQ